jgi:DNA-binding HxlR family transcriptional regulator
MSPVRRARRALVTRRPRPSQPSQVIWTPTPAETRYLAALVELGLFGETMAEVAQTLVRQGLQRAFADGFLVRTRTIPFTREG